MAPGKIITSLLIVTGFFISGCAKDVAGPREVPVVYDPVAAVDSDARCAAAAAEIAEHDAGLGGPVANVPPRQPATAGARWGSYGKNFFAQSIMGPFQPLIQTIRAATNAEDKELMRADKSLRAETRRAYLLGVLDGANCTQDDVVLGAGE